MPSAPSTLLAVANEHTSRNGDDTRPYRGSCGDDEVGLLRTGHERPRAHSEFERAGGLAGRDVYPSVRCAVFAFSGYDVAACVQRNHGEGLEPVLRPNSRPAAIAVPALFKFHIMPLSLFRSHTQTSVSRSSFLVCWKIRPFLDLSQAEAGRRAVIVRLAHDSGTMSRMSTSPSLIARRHRIPHPLVVFSRSIATLTFSSSSEAGIRTFRSERSRRASGFLFRRAPTACDAQ